MLYIDENLEIYKILKSQGLNIGSLSDVNSRYEILKIGVLNLMPLKADAEFQFSSIFVNSKRNIEITWLKLDSYNAKNTSKEYMDRFYKSWKDCEFDGIIITGAPLEFVHYEDVFYWKELCELFDVVKKNKIPVFSICWGAFAMIYHFYKINKIISKEKIFGVFNFNILDNQNKLFKEINSVNMPISRHCLLNWNVIKSNRDIKILAESENGIGLAINDHNFVYSFNHIEYEKDRLKKEYLRDLTENKSISIPKNYFVNNDPNNDIIYSWKESQNILLNWANDIKL